jgi:ACR3 family arsenite efflux pump ArsB
VLLVTTSRTADGLATKLPTLDRFLPAWIGMAMAGGLLLGRLGPGLGKALSAVEVDGISLPIAVGLLVMMYPVLAKVRYDQLGEVTSDRRLMVCSLVLNWLIGPAVMFALAWLLLGDLPEYRTGLIIVLGWFYLAVLPGWLHLPQTGIDVDSWQIAKSVLIFLGIPLLAGYVSRRLGERARGRRWYETTFLPRIGPWALYGLLFTIVILFALQGHQITSKPWDVARIALPLLAYFAIMWAGGYALGFMLRLGYARTTTLAFTAAGNNFELAIAVAIATYGVASGQALAGVVGPMIEVPVLVGLVYVSLALRARLFPTVQADPRSTG